MQEFQCYEIKIFNTLLKKSKSHRGVTYNVTHHTDWERSERKHWRDKTLHERCKRNKSDFSSLSLSAEYRWIPRNYLAVPSPLRILWGCKRQLCFTHYANIKSHLLGTEVKSCHAEEQGSWRTAPVNNQANKNYTVWCAGPGTSIPFLKAHRAEDWAGDREVTIPLLVSSNVRSGLVLALKHCKVRNGWEKHHENCTHNKNITAVEAGS